MKKETTEDKVETTEQAAPTEQTAPRMQILNQYIRDLSFENVAAQKNAGQQTQPDISVQVNLDARKGQENQFEVIQKLTISATAKATATPFLPPREPLEHPSSTLDF